MLASRCLKANEHFMQHKSNHIHHISSMQQHNWSVYAKKLFNSIQINNQKLLQKCLLLT